MLKNLFVFFSGGVEETRRAVEVEGFPWWIDPQLHEAFFRPLSAFTHWIDFRLWGDRSLPAHAQSLLWLAVLVVVARYYRRLLGPTVAAGLAAFFYAVDDARGNAVGWIASRNAILIAVFGVVALLQHDRWRRDGTPSGRFGALVAFAAGLLAGEGAIAVLGYLVAYALFLDDGSRPTRVRSLAGYFGVALLWQLLYQHLGYGASGTPFYADPWHEPRRFLAWVLRHTPIILLAQWGFPRAEMYSVAAPPIARRILFAAIVVLLVLGALLVPLVRRSRTARFWATGMLLAVLPIAATIPEDRLLALVGIGGFGLAGELLEALWLRPAAWVRRAPWRLPAVAVAAALFLVHGGLAPCILPWHAYEIATVFPEARPLALRVPTDASRPDEQVLILQGGLPVGFYLAPIRLVAGEPVPRWRVLAPQADVQLVRPDARTIRVRPLEGYLAPPTSDDWLVNGRRRFDLLRQPAHAFALGDTVRLTGVDGARGRRPPRRGDVPLRRPARGRASPVDRPTRNGLGAVSPPGGRGDRARPRVLTPTVDKRTRVPRGCPDGGAPMTSEAVSKAVLITGCSTGIGRATAEQLAACGWNVYATARKPEAMADLATKGCKTLALDVCDDASARAAVAAIERAEGAVGVLINNAGYGQEGAVEEVPLESVRRQFETNVIGLTRLIQLVLPGMRRQRWGKIVNISSVGGKLTFPGGGFYHATKHAVEALSDALRFEVRGFGIDVVVIEPGTIKTAFGDTAIASVATLGGVGSAYAAFNRAVAEKIREAYEGPLAALSAGPEAVAATIQRAITAQRPRTRYPVTAAARVLLRLRKWLPDRIFDSVLRTQFPAPR